jgi:transposase
LMGLAGLESQATSRRTFVGQFSGFGAGLSGSGLTRGDRRRNDRIDELRAVVCLDRAILSIDLGEDKQVAVLVDHVGRVLARRTVKVKTFALAGLLEWAAAQAGKRRFGGVVVGCEPTGHRWRALMGLADAAGMGFVCVQPYLLRQAREADDYTRDKTDHRDAVLIGQLVARLACYLPERAGQLWARLRHLGAQREDLLRQSVTYRQQIVDLLGCCWPAILACAARPFEAIAWLACMAAVLDSADGTSSGSTGGGGTGGGGGYRLVEWAGRGREEFFAAARGQVPRFGGKRLDRVVAGRCFTALSDPAGVLAQRLGGLERVGLLLAQYSHVTARQADIEARMVDVLDELGLTELLTSIPGLSAVGAAMILAETGDLTRFASARSVVKHAGLNPVENTSATLRGQTKLSRRGRPGLRLAAWRALWGAMPHNPVLAARFAHLTGRDGPGVHRLTAAQARVACAATLLRWIYAIATTDRPFNPDIAKGHTRPHPAGGPVTTPPDTPLGESAQAA